ncbi:formate dehydrogenase alpha subunit [Desulfosalsimonas propionicica]|uniref:Formate dehydrogenase alpha subunit n=1 Tax=Desulfosalsimonas propionicica TaxID=332175 RepID=A0A7W0C9J4_9BACT|nr:formate dehydrogenase alpha subunit [Desulfosalsimonas propionicica]
MESIALTINGKKVTCRTGDTLLSVAEKNNIFIPTLCHHPELKPYGACRMCLVEDEKSGRLMAACVTPAAKDMAVLTDTGRIINHRKNIVRLMMAEHPESCIVCSKGNRCELRALAARLGIAETRLYPMPNYKPYEELNPFIVRDLSKCILCGKCIRADHELVATGAIDYNDRGFSSRPATLMERPLEDSTCTFCGTCVSMCPTGALSAKHTGYVGTPEKQKDSICGFCGAGCSLAMGTSGGRVVDVNPLKLKGSVNGSTLCVRGHFAHDFLNNAGRLHQPLIRTRDENGDKKFEPAEWNKAVSRAAESLAEIKRTHGPGSIAFIGSPKCSTEENYLFQKIARVMFGTNNLTSTGTINGQALLRRMEEKTMGAARTMPLSGLEKAEAIVTVCFDPDNTVPVAGYHVKRAARAGTPLVTIDVRKTRLAGFAKARIRPESGMEPNARIPALICALAEKIADPDGTSTDFIQQYTSGWEECKAAIDSLLSDQPLSPAEEREIKRAAEMLSGRKISLVIGADVMEQAHGTQIADAAFDLVLSAGSIGVANAGIFIPAPESNTVGAMDMGMAPDLLPGRHPLSDPDARKHLERLWNTKLSPDPGLDLCGIVEAAESGHLKGLYIMAENLVRTLPDPERVENALEKLDFIAIQDIFENRTTRLAHVVLPGSAFAEKAGSFTNMEGRIQSFSQAAAPPGQALADWRILGLLARNMGYPEQYTTIEKIRQEIRKTVPMYAAIGNHRQEWIKNADADTPFSGNGHRFTFAALESLPPQTSQQKGFTAVLGPLRWHLAGGTRTSRSARINAWNRDNPARLSASDIESLAIPEGGKIRIVSDHGAIERSFVADPAMLPGQMFVPTGFSGNEAAALAGIEAIRTPVPAWRTCRVSIEKI